MFNKFFQFFAAAPHKPRLPDDEVKRLYPRYRWRIMESTFIGYALFYLVRNNMSVVTKDFEAALHYSASDIGSLLAITSISYGVGKFFMGSLSDRSDPRKFMAAGLLITALCNFAFGAIASFPVHMLLWGINGVAQGMGWPPCGRSQGHWFSKDERGLMFSIWNTSHNIGGGLAGIVAAWAVTSFGSWQWAFYFPGLLALIGAVYVFLRLRDTPQSVGLPPIEEYRPSKQDADAPSTEPPAPQNERELSFRELFVDNVLKNKYVMLIAFANFFAYITRYSMLDWGAYYLREMKGADVMGGGTAVLLLEFAGIASTILFGWLSDRMGGRRGMVACLVMVPIVFAYLAMCFTPAGQMGLDLAMLAIIGFCIYPVINLIVIMALDFTSKKAIGTAGGFVGLLGYLGRTAEGKGIGALKTYLEADYGLDFAWKVVMYSIVACSVIATLLLAFTWSTGHRKKAA